MKPKNFAYVGIMILAAGFAMAGLGGLVFAQSFPCIITSNTFCPYSGLQAASDSFRYALPLLILGSFLITTGAIFIAAAHISENLRPATDRSTDDSKPERNQTV